MTIATPIITDFDIEDIAPWAGNRLIDLHMATLPSRPITRFFLNHKQKKSLGYQKLRPRYEPMDEITQAPCEPLCPEGWYFDCETETCKEYSSYNLIPEVEVLTTKSISLDGVVTNLSLAGAYPTYPSIINVPSIGDIALTYTLTLVGKATSRSFSVSKTITSAEEGYLGNAKDAGNDYMSANPWGDYWYNSFGTYEYSEVVELTITITGSVEGVK